MGKIKIARFIKKLLPFKVDTAFVWMATGTLFIIAQIQSIDPLILADFFGGAAAVNLFIGSVITTLILLVFATMFGGTS